MNDDIYKVASKHGKECNFSVAVLEDKTQPAASRLAKQVAKQFITQFSQFCFDRDLTMEAGIADVPHVGQSGFLSVSKEGRRLFLLAVPHDIIEVKGDEE